MDDHEAGDPGGAAADMAVAAVVGKISPGTGPVGAVASPASGALRLRDAPLPAEQEADQLYLNLSCQSLDPYWVVEQHIRALAVVSRADAREACEQVAAVAALVAFEEKIDPRPRGCLRCRGGSGTHPQDAFFSPRNGSPFCGDGVRGSDPSFGSVTAGAPRGASGRSVVGLAGASGHGLPEAVPPCGVRARATDTWGS